MKPDNDDNNLVFGLSGLPENAGVSWVSGMSGSPAGDPRTQAKAKLEIGDALARQGRAEEAFRAYSEAARLQPNDADCRVKAGTTAWELRWMDVSLRYLKEAQRLSPQNASVVDLLAQWYHDSGNAEEAMRYSERALALTPGDPQITVNRAWILYDGGQVEAAWQLIKPLVAGGYPSAHLGVLYSRMAPQLKQEAEALAFLERILVSVEIPPAFKVPVHHAAATLLDRAGEFDRAFEQMRRGKQADRPRYDRGEFTRWIDTQINYFTAAKLHDLPHASHRSRRPVFIVGMPRSGTSLVEQILASHPQVHGAGELPTMWQVLEAMPATSWAKGERYPTCLDAMGIRQANYLAEMYLGAISALNSSATYVTDKMPSNFGLLGLIATLFPDCHVIHCTRDPLDTCLSCYMTAFTPGQPYTHDLTDLGSFYRDYRRFMDYWKTSLHYPVIEVNYEELVGDLEGQTRRLLELMDLPWDERCLRYYENNRRVITASRDQVRKPLYTSSIGRWKRYEKHLSELIAAIQDNAGTRTTMRMNERARV